MVGDYTIKTGARIYADDDDTAPLHLPETSFEITIGEPVSDLSEVFEEQDATESNSETVTYFNFKRK